MKKLVDEKKPDTLLKMKISSVRNQRDDTDTCGYQAMNFVMKRVDGQTFREASGFKDQDNTANGEKESNQLKKQLGFGYI